MIYKSSILFYSTSTGLQYRQ